MEAFPWHGRLACPAGGKVGGPLRVAKAEGPLPCIHPRGHAGLCAFGLCAFGEGSLTPFASRVGWGKPFAGKMLGFCCGGNHGNLGWLKCLKRKRTAEIDCPQNLDSKFALGGLESHFCGQSNTSSGCCRACCNCCCDDVLSKGMIHTFMNLVQVPTDCKGFLRRKFRLACTA